MKDVPNVYLKNCNVTYQNQLFFQDFSFTIRGKRITCLVGKSGVGKTTLLKVIAGIIPMKSGQVYLGKPPKSYMRAEGEQVDAGRVGLGHVEQGLVGLGLTGHVAYMAQEDLLLPWLSVLKNTLLGYALRGNVTNAKKKEATELLKNVGLGKVIHDYPHTLSGGMRQRVAIVRTLLEDKSVILMDEPFSAVDALTRLSLYPLVQRYFRHKTTVLITHDPWEAVTLGHDIYVMYGTPPRMIPCEFSPNLPLAEKYNTLRIQLQRMETEIL